MNLTDRMQLVSWAVEAQVAGKIEDYNTAREMLAKAGFTVNGVRVPAAAKTIHFQSTAEARQFGYQPHSSERAVVRVTM